MDNSQIFSINNIPDELWSKIFQEYVEIHDTRDSPQAQELPVDVIASYKARVSICSINHRMRQVAIQSPQLWTYIQLPVNLQTYSPIPLLKLWIERSGAELPIHVDFHPGGITHSYIGQFSNTQHELDVIELLRPHLHRWKSLRLFVTHSSAEALATLPLETAKKLEKLEAACYCDQEVNDKLLANVTKLPALRHLLWHRHDKAYEGELPFGIAVTKFPWQQLRSIRLSVVMSLSETLQLLSAAASAVVICLELHRDPSSSIDSMRRPLVTLPQLRCLDIRSDMGIYEVLQHLDLPGLKGFSLFASRIHSHGPNIAVAQYKDFISRISSSLDYLILNDFEFTSGDVYDFFSNPKLLIPPVARFYIREGDTLGAVEKGLWSGMRAGSDLKRNLVVQKPTFFGPYEIGWLREGGEGWEETRSDLKLPRAYYDTSTWTGH